MDTDYAVSPPSHPKVNRYSASNSLPRLCVIIFSTLPLNNGSWTSAVSWGTRCRGRWSCCRMLYSRSPCDHGDRSAQAECDSDGMAWRVMMRSQASIWLIHEEPTGVKWKCTLRLSLSQARTSGVVWMDRLSNTTWTSLPACGWTAFFTTPRSWSRRGWVCTLRRPCRWRRSRQRTVSWCRGGHSRGCVSRFLV